MSRCAPHAVYGQSVRESSAIIVVLHKRFFHDVLRANSCITWRALLIVLNFTGLLLNAHPIVSDLAATPYTDVLARWRIRRSATGAAARLPPEIQLQVFHLLRTRARFGAMERLPRGQRYFRPWRAMIPFAATRDLASAARVCRAWHGAETEALYTDVSLRHEGEVISLARTLAARPELALVVRRIRLPDDAPTAPRAILLALLPHLPRLESLALNVQLIVFDGPILPAPALSALRDAHTLRLGECTMGMISLVRLLRALPHLRVADLRRIVFAPADPHTAVSVLFKAQLRTLTELTLRITPISNQHRHARILCSDLGGFAAVRVLRVDARMLRALRVAAEPCASRRLDDAVLRARLRKGSIRRAVWQVMRLKLFQATDVPIRVNRPSSSNVLQNQISSLAIVWDYGH
ncbi:hypothetical protein AURDEDRAFT_176297 [Auricularia subglabra TFB-10046 SS5]|uniref:Uncharacterized protein n=1 Tax=Auricularia subglabra (strain TFB-10046 / SS5) TaxID=717982 RepID=J0WQ85_AURST|nr:hypothetical protein AURDEDRAFT_176297 [Auricularia subglabra TFB-10046 SS5]